MKKRSTFGAAKLPPVMEYLMEFPKTVCDLQPRDGGWINERSVVLDTDGGVWVKRAASVLPLRDANPDDSHVHVWLQGRWRWWLPPRLHVELPQRLDPRELPQLPRHDVGGYWPVDVVDYRPTRCAW